MTIETINIIETNFISTVTNQHAMLDSEINKVQNEAGFVYENDSLLNITKETNEQREPQNDVKGFNTIYKNNNKFIKCEYSYETSVIIIGEVQDIPEEVEDVV